MSEVAMSRKNERRTQLSRTRRSWAITFLGGQCVACGTRNKLEFHHKDPAQKLFGLSGARFRLSPVRLIQEIEKCELRCLPCHDHFHAAPHGSRTRYVYGKCRCDVCRSANAAYERERKARCAA